MSILAQAHGGSGGGGGAVTSVALTLPDIFSVSGSPVTSSGTLTGNLVSQAANRVFAAPDGGTGLPTFRALVAADIPSLDAAKIATGVFDVARIPALPYAAVSHTHAAADITSGILDNARVNWASPSAIGTGTQETARFTRMITAPVGTTMQSDPLSTVFSSRMYFGTTALDFYNYTPAVSAYIVSRNVNLRIGASLSWTAEPSTYMQITPNLFTIQNNAVTTSGNTQVFGMNSPNNSIIPSLNLYMNSTVNPTTEYGTGIGIHLRSSTTNSTFVGRQVWKWVDTTHASRKVDFIVELTDFAGTREVLRGRADGSAAAIGFLGATPVARQSVATTATDLASAITLVNDLRAALIAFGLVN